MLRNVIPSLVVRVHTPRQKEKLGDQKHVGGAPIQEKPIEHLTRWFGHAKGKPREHICQVMQQLKVDECQSCLIIGFSLSWFWVNLGCVVTTTTSLSISLPLLARSSAAITWRSLSACAARVLCSASRALSSADFARSSA